MTFEGTHLFLHVTLSLVLFFPGTAIMHFPESHLLLNIFSENKPKNGGICVANHTSPIDVIILASDGCYAMVPTRLLRCKVQVDSVAVFRTKCVRLSL